MSVCVYVGLPRWLSGTESACDAGDTGDSGLIPGSERSSGGGNGNPLQYSCLGNPIDRGAWQATVHGVVVLDMAEHTSSTYTCPEIPRLINLIYIYYIQYFIIIYKGKESEKESRMYIYVCIERGREEYIF